MFFGPRLTLLLLLAWGVLAAGWVLAGRIARSLSGPRNRGRADLGPGAAWPAGEGLVAYRGDGILARWFGLLVAGTPDPAAPAAGRPVRHLRPGRAGLGNLSGILILTRVEAMFLAALGAWHPHDGRLDWLVPAC